MDLIALFVTFGLVNLFIGWFNENQKNIHTKEKIGGKANFILAIILFSLALINILFNYLIK